MTTLRVNIIFGTIMILTMILTMGAEAQSPMTAPSAAPGPALDCTSLVLNMSDCLSYVEVGSNDTKPDPKCCPEVAGLVDTQPICLCVLLGQAGSYGVDVKRALKLPGVCKIPTPDVNLCSAFGAPVSLPSPSGAPGASRTAAGAPKSLPSPGQAPGPASGTASSPESGSPSNAAPTIAASHLYFLVGLATAIVSTFF